MYQRRRPAGIGLIIAVIVAVFSLIRYYGSSQVNPVTGEKQRVAGITAEQEIALGLQSAPQMAREFGGVSRDARADALVDAVGERLVSRSGAGKSPYQFDFHVLNDNKTVNAFALPGGQIFITEALLARLKTEGQLAGVVGHEIGHVVGRHGAEHIAKQQLTQGLTGAAVLATYDPNNPRSSQTAQMALLIGQLVNMKFGRADELESDKFGVQYMADAGYDPRSMIEVMKILAEAGGGRGGPEFFQTHPNPENRIGQIEKAIREVFPNGVPAGLEK
ncbi:MAG TPA: M48 family metalloprotease [Armatimonadaceae bacterium]|nr:M48 family metalloprotease [Armatimonadaceae bacterium]